jgi:hypothetical protein
MHILSLIVCQSVEEGENTAVCESDKKDGVHANYYAIVASRFNAFL